MPEELTSSQLSRSLDKVKSINKRRNKIDECEEIQEKYTKACVFVFIQSLAFH